ncbi:MAG: hypothetical protein E5X63_27170, partial [Mesorhizobium sp.]
MHVKALCPRPNRVILVSRGNDNLPPLPANVCDDIEELEVILSVDVLLGRLVENSQIRMVAFLGVITAGVKGEHEGRYDADPVTSRGPEIGPNPPVTIVYDDSRHERALIDHHGADLERIETQAPEIISERLLELPQKASVVSAQV